MSCPKCAGLLVEYFVDTYDLQDKRSRAVSCVNCGYYADAVTTLNKAKQADARRLVAQAEGWVVAAARQAEVAR